MNFTSLPLHSTPDHYGRQAADLGVSEQALAHEYGFDNWPALADYAAQLSRENSPILPLRIGRRRPDRRRRLHSHASPPRKPNVGASRLPPASSSNAPPLHRRQWSGAIPPEIPRQRRRNRENSLERRRRRERRRPHVAGAEASTLEMLVSSAPPYRAGVQIPLVETLLDFGASNLERALMTALAHGYQDAAQTLATARCPRRQSRRRRRPRPHRRRPQLPPGLRSRHAAPGSRLRRPARSRRHRPPATRRR